MHLFSFDDCIILGYSLDSRTIWNWINFSFKSCLTTEREKQEEKGKSFLPLNLFSLTSEIRDICYYKGAYYVYDSLESANKA